MSEHSTLEVALDAPDGFRVIQREVEDGMNLIHYDVSITTKLSTAVPAEALESATFQGEVPRYAVRALARRVIEQCEAVLR